jgi:hypothetical protein
MKNPPGPKASEGDAQSDWISASCENYEQRVHPASFAARTRKIKFAIRWGAMLFLIFKYGVTAAIVVAVSEVAKRSDRLGALIASLPLVTLLALFWLHIEDQPTTKVANHAYYTFWYVLPTLPMFLAFPKLLNRFGFWPALGLSVVLTLALFGVYGVVLRRFGVNLL